MQIIFQDPFASLNPRMRVAEIMEEGVASLRPETAPAEQVLERPRHAYTQTLLAAVPRLARAA